jgi:hypothetical protein
MDNCYARLFRELTLLELMGSISELQNYLIDKQKVKTPNFKFHSKSDTVGYYRSSNDKLTRQAFLDSSYLDMNYLILNELSLKLKWDNIEQLIERFNFEMTLCWSSSWSFYSIKLEILLNMLVTKNDASLLNRLFEVCSDFSKKSLLEENILYNTNRKVNFSAIGYLQLSYVLNQIGLTEHAIKAINEAFLRKNEDYKSDSPTNSQIIKVFIHICMSSLDKDEILDQFSKIIKKFNFYLDENLVYEIDEYPEELLSLLIEPLVQIEQTHKASQVVDMILKIIENIPIKHTKMYYIKDGMELPNHELARKHKSISNISYFYFLIGDFKKGDEYYNMLSDELIYDSDTFYGDTHYQVGFDRDEIKNKFKNKTFTKYEKVISENITLKENELEFNGAVYEDFKDRKIMESNFDYSFSKNNIEFQFLSKNQNPNDVFSYLFYKAKMACFFEEEQDEEILDLVSEVIDISEWRQLGKEINKI